MNPALGIFLLAIARCLCCHAQDPMPILACGKVRDATTNKAIRADIHYSSLPTRSISGHFNDSAFSFTVFGTARYEITAKANGYKPMTVILDPTTWHGESRIERDIRLIPVGQTTIRLNRLIFAQGRAEIERDSFEELDALALMMHDNPKMIIQLEGHTDNVGSARANLRLSEERVEAVRDYLIQRGVARNRIRTKAYGGAKPIRNEQTAEARAMNRRVEVRIVRN